jgi:hypothetical protein
MFEKYDFTFGDDFKKSFKDLYKGFDYKIGDDLDLGDDLSWDNDDMMKYFKEMLYKSHEIPNTKETPEQLKMKTRQAKIDELLK